MPPRSFRFGVVAAQARSGTDWLESARRVESLGYATLVVPDTLRYTLAPLPALAAAAAATRSLRLGSYVLDNDLRHPVLLAKDAASLDVLSDGRLELGLGAGRAGAGEDVRMLGRSFDSGGVRVARLAEALGLLKALLAGETVTHQGDAYSTVEAQVSPPPVQRPHPPIMVAGSGRRLLELAAREADIIALGAAQDASEPVVAEKIGWIRDAAGARFEQIELSLNLMAVGDRVPRFLAAQFGLTAQGLADAGAVSALVGTPEQMADRLLRHRDRFGLSYFVVADELMDALAPVVDRLAGR